MNTEELKRLSPLELMLAWNRYCDAHNREGDCILLNEGRTYVEAFENREQAMREIVTVPDQSSNEMMTAFWFPSMRMIIMLG